MRLKDATNAIIFEDKRRWLFLILYGFFLVAQHCPFFAPRTKQLLCAFTFLRLYFRKLRSSLIIFLSISMRVILPISLLLSAVVALTVSRSLPSSTLPSLSLRPGSFVILCRDTCVHMHAAYVYSRLLIFLILSPYRLSPILLWIWYFLILPTRSRLSFCYTPLFLLFRRVSFRPPIRHRCYLSYSPYNRIHSPSSLPLFHVNLVLTLSFLFPAFLFGVHLFLPPPPPFLFYPFIASSPRPHSPLLFPR